MSMTTRNTSDTSVTFSLAELAKIEEERVREEDVQRARTRESQAREQREAEARRRAEEAAEVAAQAEARARREVEQAAAKARAEARERAASDVARIEAEAKARLEADNAARAHEIALLRARTEGGRRRTQTVLAVALGLVLCGGGAAAYGATRHVSALEQDTARLREGQTALARERDNAKSTELASLDRRHAALRARTVAGDTAEARATAEAARSAIDTKAPDHGRLRAFSDALDALQARFEALDKVAALSRRHADLAAWAASLKRAEVGAEAQTAAARVKATSGDETSIRLYEAALDQMRSALAQSVAAPGGRLPPIRREVVAGVCPPGDPGCGLDGKPLF